MPTLNISNITQSSVNWNVSGLGSVWDDNNYQKIRLSTGNVSNGSTTAPSGQVDEVFPPTSGTNSYTPTRTAGGLNASTSYTLYTNALALDNKWYNAGSQSFTTLAPPAPSPPTNISSSVSGLNITISFTKGANSTETELDQYWISGLINSTTTGSSFSFSVNNYNTTYSYDMRGKNGTSYSSWTSVQSFVTGNIPSPAAPSATRIPGGISASWNSVSGATSYTLKVRRAYDNYETTYSTSSTSYNVTGLQYGVTHYICVRAHQNSSVSSYSSENPITTAPKEPVISQGTVTSSSVQINASVSEGSITEIQVEQYSSSSVYLNTKFISGSNGNVTWTGLVAGTTYIFKARSRFNLNGTDIYSVNYSNQLTIQVSARPANFAWTNVKTPNQSINVSASEWTSFTNKINQFRVYKSLSTVSFITVTPNVTSISASICNQARNAISDMNPQTSPPGTVTANVTSISANYFNLLRDSLNSIV